MTSVKIHKTHTKEGVVYYELLVKSGVREWTCLRRYNDFDALHEHLVKDHSVARDKLPKKKVLGNKSAQFVEQRQAALEVYLQYVLHFLALHMPEPLVRFLDLHHYDSDFLLQTLARHLFENGEKILLKDFKQFNFYALQLHAIGNRLSKPCPTHISSTDRRCDYSHILDFCGQLETVTVVPLESDLNNLKAKNIQESLDSMSLNCDSPVSDAAPMTYEGTSNIDPLELQLDLRPFKFLSKLSLLKMPPTNLINLGSTRKTIQQLIIQNTAVIRISDILLCDDLHKEAIEQNAEKCWNVCHLADFSFNQLTTLDESLALLPRIASLTLAHNKIEQLSNLSKLPLLRFLDLSYNRLKIVGSWHLELGCVTNLNLSHNVIKQLAGLSKLYALQRLDLSANLIDDWAELDHLGMLPCIEHFGLNGNPIAQDVDYRAKALSRFSERLVNELYVDNERGALHEIDTALVLRALRIAKQQL